MQEMAYQHSRCENRRKRIYTLNVMHTFPINRYFSLPIYSIIQITCFSHCVTNTFVAKNNELPRRKSYAILRSHIFNCITKYVRNKFSKNI